jgi:pimeloyl-ACP methyl ester carboxylesterase
MLAIVSDVIHAPAPAADGLERSTFEIKGGRVAGIWYGAAKANPDIVFLHATGFNARTYRSLLAPIGDRFRVLALDLRGHGRTELPAKTFGYTSWNRHRDDVIAVLEHFSAPVSLAGHSMGATVSVLVAGRRPDLVASLGLLEPVIQSSLFYAVGQLPLMPTLRRSLFPIAKAAAKRRAQFSDAASARDALRGRGVFKAFTDEVIADYVGDGFKSDGVGGLTLSCTPRYEAATFCAQRHDPWAALRAIGDPIVLLRAETNSTISNAGYRRLAALKPQARVAIVEGAGHMLPMERPDRARAAIESAALMGRAGRRFHDMIE